MKNVTGYKNSDIFALLERDGAVCHYCGCELIDYRLWYLYFDLRWHHSKKGDRRYVLAWHKKTNVAAPTRDHVIPRSKGGPNTLENMVLACASCNGAKSDMSVEEFLESKNKSDR